MYHLSEYHKQINEIIGQVVVKIIIQLQLQVIAYQFSFSYNFRYEIKIAQTKPKSKSHFLDEITFEWAKFGACVIAKSD